jgi:hypothetical protein
LKVCRVRVWGESNVERTQVRVRNGDGGLFLSFDVGVADGGDEVVGLLVV